MSVSANKAGLSAGSIGILLVSAVLNSLSLIYINFFLALPAVSLILYLLIRSGSGRVAFYYGALFGGISSLLLNYWMIPVVEDYAKGNLVLSLSCYLASMVALGAFFGLQFYLFSLIRYPEGKRFALCINAFNSTALWVLFEFIRTELFSAIPWISYTTGITQGRDLFLIQPAAYGGVLMLSFIILLAAYFIASCFHFRNWKLLMVAAGIIAAQYAAGYFIYRHAGHLAALDEKNKFSLALVMPGLSPDKVWNESSADGLVAHLFSLNKKAAEKSPDLIVWTETVVPWTYTPEDDFINELAKQTRTVNSHSLIGMNAAFSPSGETLCNSVYLLDPDGTASGRYDKQDLLTLVEKPLLSRNGNLILPFLDSYGLQMRPGKNRSVVATPWGKAGIMICNESTNAAQANRLAKDGAGFLVNVGNNNWFSDHFITRQHFYNCRLRAVENRKDMIVNNNMGSAGLVRSNGEIIVYADAKKSGVLPAEVYPNHRPVYNPDLFIYFISCVLLFSVVAVKLTLIIKTNKIPL